MCLFFLSFLFLSLFLWFLLPFYSFTTHTNTTGIHSNSFWWVNTEKLNKKHKILLFTTSNFYLWTCMTTTRSNIIVANVVEDVLIFGKIIGWSTPFSTAIYHDGTKKKQLIVDSLIECLDALWTPSSTWLFLEIIKPNWKWLIPYGRELDGLEKLKNFPFSDSPANRLR